MSGGDVLRVEGELRAALAPAALGALDGERLARFLAGRRWFGAKGKRTTAVRVADVVPLPWDGGRFAVARLAVETGGRTLLHQLPLAVRAADAAGDAPEAVLAEVEAGGERGVLHDAVEDAVFRAELGRAFERGARFEGERTRWVIEPLAGGDTAGLADAPSRVGSAEQSNTSIVFGDRAILKLFRRLEPGENPDVEIAGFLTARAKFAHTPALLGTVRFEDADGTRMVAAMLQAFEPGSTDAWSHALEVGRRYFAAPRGEEPANDFLRDAERLGRVTRELHDALASAGAADTDFAPRPATPDDVERWADGARRSIEQGLDLLAARLEARGLPAERQAEGRVLVDRRGTYLAYVDEIEDAVGAHAGARIRHHGDYHLGQVLRTRSGNFKIIDFEGEPARPLEERRAPHSALRDVAGMLRSFAYAAATLATDAGATLDMPTRELRTGRWERDARDAFLRAYLGDRANATRFLPDTPEAVTQLLALFETEKAFYELAYELNNRPDWVWIPMRGISKLLTAARARA